MDACVHTAVALDCPTNPIFIVGAPRSGTTWLAKIFDSHPDVLYRHEPDQFLPAPATLHETDLPPLFAAWCRDTSLRTAAKRPFFRKSWQPQPLHLARVALAYGMMAAARLPLPLPQAPRWPVPDLGDTRKARIVIKTVEWCDGIGLAARHLPDSRTVVILRRPGGQVFSVMRGARQRRFELRQSGDMPLNEQRAMAHAARYGIDRATFMTLPEAARYAWDWVAFNEAIEQGIAGRPNVRTVLYEDLCERPDELARELLGFAGLPWNLQTEAFVRESTTASTEGSYYGVVRDALRAANRWRTEMPLSDQEAVAAVARRSSLARHWPDLLREDT